MFRIKGNDNLAPWIILSGNNHIPQEAMEQHRSMFGHFYRGVGMPTVYGMEYWSSSGDNPADLNEKLLTRNARKMFDFVIKTHSQKPHVFGWSLGCAVSVAAIYSGRYDVASLTLQNPFTSFNDVVVKDGFTHFIAKNCCGFCANLKLGWLARCITASCWFLCYWPLKCLV